MKKNATVTLRLDIADEVLLEKVIERCRKHPWISSESKSDMFRYALRFLNELDDASFFRVMTNSGIPNPFEVKMKTE